MAKERRIEMTARKRSPCRKCFGAIRPGDKIIWFPVYRKAEHLDCTGKEHPDPYAGYENSDWSAFGEEWFLGLGDKGEG